VLGLATDMIFSFDQFQGNLGQGMAVPIHRFGIQSPLYIDVEVVWTRYPIWL